MLKTVGNPSTRYGDQTVIDGNLVIGTAGKGIDFSAFPAAAGVTSELLDDYEEGVWTPAISGWTGTTYTSQIGRYTKVGRFVTVWGQMDVSALGTFVSNTRLTGFPFAPDTSTNNFWSGLLAMSTLYSATRDDQYVDLYLGTAVAYIKSKVGVAANGSTGWAASGILSFVISYEAS